MGSTLYISRTEQWVCPGGILSSIQVDWRVPAWELRVVFHPLHPRSVSPQEALRAQCPAADGAPEEATQREQAAQRPAG